MSSKRQAKEKSESSWKIGVGAGASNHTFHTPDDSDEDSFM